ncbi:MAG: hypothetical protein R2795_19995 [Saprospiraceae bacterium]
MAYDTVTVVAPVLPVANVSPATQAITCNTACNHTRQCFRCNQSHLSMDNLNGNPDLVDQSTIITANLIVWYSY